MTTKITPEFITQALYDLDYAEGKKRLERRQKSERLIKEMFESIRLILGDAAADEIISGGHSIVSDDMDCWQYEEYGFHPVSGYACGNEPAFRFAVLNEKAGIFTSISGWTIINNTKDLAKQIKSAEEMKNRRERAVEAQAPDNRKNYTAEMFEQIATRVRTKRQTDHDKLLIAIAHWLNSVEYDGDNYNDDDDDDLPDEQD